MDLSISLPKAPHILKQEENKALIEISALYPGYGATLGNSLRRVLYSSLPGAAIVHAKIDKALHEFSTLEGVLEDVMEIALNLKAIRLVLHSDEPQTLKLSAKGKKVITAKNIETPSQVTIINKDAHIATLTATKAELNIEMSVEKGLGYVQVEQESKDKKEIGVLRLDAVFSPIVKVNFDVENMRVGDRIDYNRLLVEITTDGTITPEYAYEQAVEILSRCFGAVSEIDNKPTPPKPKKTSKAKASKTASAVK